MDLKKKYDDTGRGKREKIDPIAAIAAAAAAATKRKATPTLFPSGAISGAAAGGAGVSLPSKTTGTGGSQYRTSQSVTVPAGVGTFSSENLDKANSIARILEAMNYGDWTKGDAYQALAGRYGENGRISMQNTLGQVASRTGGLASSYAASAAQQQYNQYMAQLEEVARQLYSQERDDLMDSASLYRNLANDEYDRYRDSLSDYNARLKAAQSAARSAYGGTSYNSGKTYNRNAIGTVSSSGGETANSYSSSFSDIKRTISGRIAAGNMSGASQLVESVWDDLTPKQKQEIRKMGFNVTE
jgi:hypothetical protein